MGPFVLKISDPFFSKKSIQKLIQNFWFGSIQFNRIFIQFENQGIGHHYLALSRYLGGLVKKPPCICNRRHKWVNCVLTVSIWHTKLSRTNSVLSSSRTMSLGAYGIVLSPRLLGHLDTLVMVPSAFKANKFSGPPAALRISYRVLIRAVELESREKSKNRKKSEKSDLITYPTCWQKCQNAINCHKMP